MRPTFERTGPPPSAYRRHGEGSWLVPPVRVEGPGQVEIGVGVVIMEHLILRVAPGARVCIGDGVRLGRYASITAHRSIEIGEDAASSDYVAITDGWGALAPIEPTWPAPAAAPVVIGAGAYLAAGCSIGPGVTVGRGAFVGEGAAVLEDVPDHAVVHGNPARVVRQLGPAGWTGTRFG